MRHWIIGLAVLAASFAAGCDETENNVVVDLATPQHDLATGGGAQDLATGGGAQDLATGGAQDLASALPMTAAVSVRDNFYTPASVTIARGGTVTWTWAGAVAHSVTSGTGTPSGMFDSGIKASGTFSFTFNTAGTFPYYCMVHGAAVMSGTVTVQ